MVWKILTKFTVQPETCLCITVVSHILRMWRLIIKYGGTVAIYIIVMNFSTTTFFIVDDLEFGVGSIYWSCCFRNGGFDRDSVAGCEHCHEGKASHRSVTRLCRKLSVLPTNLIS